MYLISHYQIGNQPLFTLHIYFHHHTLHSLSQPARTTPITPRQDQRRQGRHSVEGYAKFVAFVPFDEYHYAVFNFVFVTIDGCPKIRVKILYAMSKDEIRRAVEQIHYELVGHRSNRDGSRCPF
ncbi:hypothetical protein V2J09_010747 [Rumex salicifolius]